MCQFLRPGCELRVNSEIPVVTIDYVHHNCTAVTSNNIQGMEDLVKVHIQSGTQKNCIYSWTGSGPVLRWDRLASFFIGRLMSLT